VAAKGIRLSLLYPCSNQALAKPMVGVLNCLGMIRRGAEVEKG